MFLSSLQYLAPEVLQKQAYDRTVDWWCLGSVLYEMLYGLVSASTTSVPHRLLRRLTRFLVLPQPPFYSRNTAEMYNNILHKSPVLKPNVSNAGRELLEGLLHKDRTKRLGARDDFVSVGLWFCCTFETHGSAHCGSVPLQLELKFHSFFSPISWDDLMAKKITPPFIPSVVRSGTS